LYDVAEHDLLRGRRIDFGAVESLLDDNGREVGTGKALERSAKGADCRSHGTDDDDIFVIGHFILFYAAESIIFCRGNFFFLAERKLLKISNLRAHINMTMARRADADSTNVRQGVATPQAAC